MIGTIVSVLSPYTLIAWRDTPPSQPSPSLFVILTSALPAGIDSSTYVYFENPSGNVAANVRQAVKSTSRNAQYFEVDSWS
jgi:hypothetical protein